MPPPRRFFCKCIRIHMIFSTSTEKFNRSSVFDKIMGYILPGQNYIKGWSTIEFSLKLFVLRQLVCGIFSKKNLYSRVVVCTLEVCDFSKIYSIISIFMTNCVGFCNQLFFVNTFICVEESNYIEDYVKVRSESKEKGRLLPFLH